MVGKGVDCRECRRLTITRTMARRVIVEQADMIITAAFDSIKERDK